MKVLIIDKVHDILIEKLEEKGFMVDYLPDIKVEGIENQLSGYAGIIVRSKLRITKEIINAAVNLKFIARVGAGMENIDVKYAESKGIKCFNSPEGNRDAVGEQSLAMLLMLLNKLYKAHQEVAGGIWQREKNRGLELKNKTVGILGYGNMGSAFAEKLRGMECQVIAYDKYKFNFSNSWVREVNIDQLYDETDILSLHVPLTEETKYMVDKSFIESFRKPFFLINTARGPVVKTQELVNKLESGKILGAALDVLEFEKSTFEELHGSEEMPDYFQKLVKMDNVLLSPHIAGWTEESNHKLSEIIATKILDEFIL